VRVGDGAVSQLMGFATEAMDWDAAASTAAAAGLGPLPLATRAQIDSLPAAVTGRPLLQHCPLSCGGCGLIGNMLGTSMKTFEMITQVTKSSFEVAQATVDTSFAVAQTTVDTSFVVTETTVDTSFAATETTVGASYDTLTTGANAVASGVGSACDALDEWAPLIDAASDTVGFFEDAGSVLSSFRRLEGSAPAHSAELTHHRRLDYQSDCRSTEDSADGLVTNIGDSKADTLTQIGTTRNDVTGAITNTHNDVNGALTDTQGDVTGALNTAEQRILQAVQLGRDSMVTSFEKTRELTRKIRRNLPLIKNTTSQVFTPAHQSLYTCRETLGPAGVPVHVTWVREGGRSHDEAAGRRRRRPHRGPAND
jgi:hypothetical protein